MQFPQFFTGSDSLKQLIRFRNNSPQLRIKHLIDNALEALHKQGPQDSSSSQTGDLPTPSCHGLGLLAKAASDAADAEYTEKRDPSNFGQLLRAVRSNVPDSVPVNCDSNDGRGECSEDEARLTRPLSATGGSRVASRATADAWDAAGAAAGGGGVGAAAAGAAGGGAKASRPRNAPQSSVTPSLQSAQMQAEPESRRRRRRRRRPSRSRAAGADAGGVGVAQASGIEGELTFTPTVPEPSDRGTRRIAADWRQPPIFQCRSID